MKKYKIDENFINIFLNAVGFVGFFYDDLKKNGLTR